jgi:hypothetical protein
MSENVLHNNLSMSRKPSIRPGWKGGDETLPEKG